MTNVLIVGAGPAGLAAGIFAARRGHCVTMVEHDPAPNEETGLLGLIDWERRGAPHANQGHLFLARSTAVLREESPDLLSAILAAGAREIPLPVSPGAGPVLSRRLVYEGILRQAVAQEPGVTMITGAHASSLVVAGRRDGVPVVAGVKIDTGETISADLVIDACGKRSAAARWLVGIGARPPREVRYECRFVMFNRHYRLREGNSFPTFRVPIVAMLEYATITVFPADNDVFSLSVLISADDPFRRRLRLGRILDRFLAEVPLTAAWLERGIPLDEPHVMADLANYWRRLTDERGPVVHGFALLGDAAMRTSPTLGRGVSLAFAHAQQLARALDQAKTDSVAFILGFEQWTAEHLGVWFESQVAADRVRADRLQAALRGQVPEKMGSIDRFMAALWTLRNDHPVVEGEFDRVFHLLSAPREIFHNRAVIARVNAYLSGRAILDSPTGPGRLEFERLTGD